MAGSLNDGSQMDSAIAALTNQLQQAWAYVGMGSVFSDSASDEAIAKALNQYGQKITDLDTRLRRDVLASALTIDKWLGIAATTADGIKATSGYSVGWEDFMSQVVAKSGTDIAHTVDSVTSASTPYILAGIAILVLILAIKVT